MVLITQYKNIDSWCGYYQLIPTVYNYAISVIKSDKLTLVKINYNIKQL